MKKNFSNFDISHLKKNEEIQTTRPIVEILPESKIKSTNASETSTNTIFAANFSDGETLKNVFNFLASSVDDVCSVQITKEYITFFKIKKSNMNTNVPIMIIDIKIDTEELLQFYLQPNKKMHSFDIETDSLKTCIKDVKTNDSFYIYQNEGESFIQYSLLGVKMKGGSKVGIKAPTIEKCDFNSTIFSENLTRNTECILDEFTTYCATITKIKKVMAPIHFKFHKSGFEVNPEHPDSIRRNWGICDETFSHYFIFAPETIKSLGAMKKFNKRGILKYYYCDDLVIRLDSAIGSFGYISLYLFNDKHKKKDT